MAGAPWKIMTGCLVLATVACISSLEPTPRATPPVMLYVTNTTCTPGSCTALQVLLFPSDQPDVPAGPWSLSLGTVTGSGACLTIPASAEFKVNGSVVATWTTADSGQIGSVPPSAPGFQAMPSSGEFVPTSGSGWSVTLPSSSTPVQSGACTP